MSVDDIKTLLSSLGAENFNDETDSKEQLITNTVCHNHSSGSMKLYYSTTSKTFRCFTHCSTNYDIYSLVQKVFENRGKTLTFRASIDYVAKVTGRGFGFGFGADVEIEDSTNEELDWMNSVSAPVKIQPPEIKYYNESILEVFSSHGSPTEFIGDNISKSALDKYGIRYYDKGERIVLVNRHWESGKIIGLRGRYIGEHSDGIAKYMPLVIQGHTYSYPTFINLYGLWENKEQITKIKKVIIFESEKSVLQCSTFYGENNFAVALSGRNISQFQIDILLNLGIESVIIALDKQFRDADTRLEREDIAFILRMGRKFAPYVRTYTLFDTEGVLEYKDAPSDKNKATLEFLLANKQEILSIE